jgi:hypothetical protein
MRGLRACPDQDEQSRAAGARDALVPRSQIHTG